MPSPDRLLRTIHSGIQAFRATPGRRGRLVHLQDCTEVLVAGDMHGNLNNFRFLLELAQLREHPTRHFVVQELIHSSVDYQSGGDRSHLLLDILAALKCEFPRQVHMLLGNHELAQWTGQKITKGDRDPVQWFNKGVVSAYGARAWDVMTAYMELFAAFAVAIRTSNRVFLSHSLPSQKRLGTFDPAVLERDDYAEKELHFGGSIHSIVWGRDTRRETVDAYLQKVDADLLISGHMPNETGFEIPNDRQLILDTMRSPAGYCLFPADRPLTHQELVQCVSTF